MEKPKREKSGVVLWNAQGSVLCRTPPSAGLASALCLGRPEWEERFWVLSRRTLHICDGDLHPLRCLPDVRLLGFRRGRSATQGGTKIIVTVASGRTPPRLAQMRLDSDAKAAYWIHALTSPASGPETHGPTPAKLTLRPARKPRVPEPPYPARRQLTPDLLQELRRVQDEKRLKEECEQQRALRRQLEKGRQWEAARPQPRLPMEQLMEDLDVWRRERRPRARQPSATSSGHQTDGTQTEELVVPEEWSWATPRETGSRASLPVRYPSSVNSTQYGTAVGPRTPTSLRSLPVGERDGVVRALLNRFIATVESLQAMHSPATQPSNDTGFEDELTTSLAASKSRSRVAARRLSHTHLTHPSPTRRHSHSHLPSATPTHRHSHYQLPPATPTHRLLPPASPSRRHSHAHLPSTPSSHRHPNLPPPSPGRVHFPDDRRASATSTPLSSHTPNFPLRRVSSFM